ncbi:hypothetical protein [Bosea sp. ASV33]|uniref:hypothetical protein n=1 Tax=Bosea sp. ASV33 TaxID=2795106 RepID=UPI0018EB347B|nr:hypothetical protein [Bosea sp. ASV33]
MNVTISRITDLPTPLDNFRRQHCLDDILDARLVADRRVVDFHGSSRQDSILQSSDAPPGSVIRIARLPDRILQIVAISDGFNHQRLGRRLRRHSPGANILVVSELWLRRRPHLDVSELIVASARYPVSPLAHLHLAEHLTDHGGSAPLIDCAALMTQAEDPVRAVLAVAASKAISIDISRPLGPYTKVTISSAR